MRAVSRIVSVTAVIAFAALLTGCLSTPVSIAASSTPITSKTKVTKLGAVSGDAWALMVFGYPLSEPTPMKNARDRAIDQKGADALIDITVENRQFLLGPFSLINTHIEAEAVKID